MKHLFMDDLVNKNNLLEIFKNFKPCTVINLAAQAGVRYSLKNPTAYVNSNIVGFLLRSTPHAFDKKTPIFAEGLDFLRSQVGIYTVVHEESESEVEKCQI